MGALAAGWLLALAAAVAPRAGRHPLWAVSGWGVWDQALAGRLVAADLPGTITHPVAVWVGLLGAGAVGGFAIGQWVGAAAMVVVGTVGSVVGLLVRGDRSDQQLRRQLPGFVDALGRQLRAGRSLPQAFEELRHGYGHPLDRDLSLMSRRLDRGRALDEELARWARSRSLVELGLVTTALALGQRSGGARVAALEAVGQTLRDQQAVARELTALTAQARVSAAVVAAAPLAFAGLLWLSGVAPVPSPDRPPVLAAMVVGLVLDGIGLVWMRRIGRRRW